MTTGQTLIPHNIVRRKNPSCQGVTNTPYQTAMDGKYLSVKPI